MNPNPNDFSSLRTSTKATPRARRFVVHLLALICLSITRVEADPATFSSQAVERGSATPFTTPVGPAVADFDDDGFADVATSDATTGAVYISFGSADGSEVNVTTTTGPTSPVALVADDLDNDGFPDLVFAKAGEVQAWINDDSGTFNSATFTIASPAVTITRIATAVDFNGDGLPDIVAIGTGDDGLGGSAGFVEIFLSQANASGKLTGYAAPVTFDGDMQPNALVVADLNHDGFPDVVFSDATSKTVHVYFGDPNAIANSTDILINEQDVDLGTHTPASLAVGDVTRDDVLDIVATSSVVDAVHNQTLIYVDLIHNHDDETFELNTSFGLDFVNSVTVPASAVAVGDVNGDGNEDIVAVTARGKMKVLRVVPLIDVSGALIEIDLEGVDTFAVGAGAQTITLRHLDGDTKFDALISGAGEIGVLGLLNTTTVAAVGNGVQFERPAYSLDKGIPFVLFVDRPNSAAQIDVPFTVAGTCIASHPNNPSAPSDFNLDFPDNKLLHFDAGQTKAPIYFSISSELAPGVIKTIILTLKTPHGPAVLGFPTTTTLTIIRGPVALHAATALKATPSNKIKLTLDDIHGLHLIAGGRAFSPWTFEATQKLDKTEPGLIVRVQSSIVAPPNEQWEELGNGRMILKGGKGTTWTTTVDSVPTCSRLYFRTVTSAPGDNEVPGPTSGPYKAIKSPHLELSVTQAREGDALLPGGFSVGEIATHNDEGIIYRFRYQNTGNEDATNATMEVNLPRLGHFQTATTSSLSGAQLFQIDKHGKATSSSTDTVAVRWFFPTVAIGTDRTVDMVITVVSANEYNPKYPTASFDPFQLSLSTRGFFEAPGQGVHSDSTPELIARINSPIKLELKADGGLSTPGGYITYTLTATNLSGVDMATPVITDLVPFGTVLDTVYDDDGAGNFVGAAVSPPGPLSHSNKTPPTSLAIAQLSGGGQTMLQWTLDKLPKSVGGSSPTRTMKFKVRVLFDVPTVVYDSTHVSHTAEIVNNQYQLHATPPSGGTIPAFVAVIPAVSVGLASNPNLKVPIPGLRKDAQGQGTLVLADGTLIATVAPADGAGNGVIHYRIHLQNSADPSGGLPLHHLVVHDFINADTTANKPIDSTFVNVNSITLKNASGTVLPISANLLSTNHFVLMDGLGHPLPAGADVKTTRAIDFTLGGDLPAMGLSGDWLIEYDVEARSAATLKPDAIGTDVTTGDYYMTSDSLFAVTVGAPRFTFTRVVAPVALSLLPTSIELPAPPAGSNFTDGVLPGASFFYDLFPTNSGGLTAARVILTSVLPKGVVFQGFFNKAGTDLDPANPMKNKSGTVTFNHDALAPLKTGFIRLKCQLQSDLDKTFPAALRALGASFLMQASLSGGYISSSHLAGSRALANSFVPVAEATTSPTEIAVARPLQPTLFLGKIAPLAVPEGDLLNYTLFFGNTGNDTARGVTVAIILPDQTEIFGTSPKVTQYDSRQHRAQWNIGDLPAHTAGAVILTVKVKQDSGTILENSAVINALNAVGQVAGPVTTTVSATSFFGRLHEGWNNAFGGLHINLGDAIKTNSFLQTDFKTIRPDSQFVATGNAPVIILKSVGFLIPLGPIAGVGQVLVGGRPGAITGGNELVTGLPMKLVSGSGNQIDVKDVGMASADNLGILLENIHGDHGTQLSEIGNVAIKGPGLVTNDGTMALNNDGQAPSVPLSIRKGAGLITDKGAGAVMAGAGSLIGNDGGTLIGNDGGTLTGTAGGALISASSGLISDKGNGLIGEKGSGLIGNDGGTFISHNGSAVTSK